MARLGNEVKVGEAAAVGGYNLDLVPEPSTG